MTKNTLEINEQIQHLQKRLDALAKAKKEDIGYVAEAVALKEKIRLLKWVLEEE